MEVWPVDWSDELIQSEECMVSLVQDPYCFPTMIYGTIWHAESVVNANENIQEPCDQGQDLVRPDGLDLMIFFLCEGIYCQSVRGLN